MQKCFIDTHCHVFNIVDIPLYASICGKLKMGTIKRFILAFGATLGGSINIAKKDAIEEKVNNFKEFILFFERSVDSNIEFILEEIKENILSIDRNIDINTYNILITPLVMDFDKVLEIEMPNEVLKEPKVERQYERIKEALKVLKLETHHYHKVCPFVGFDLRKLLDENKFNNFKDFFMLNYEGSQNFNNLKSGQLLGIKLYPSLGFNPYPHKDNEQTKYIEFFKWCCENDIPITSHTQKSSYYIGLDKDSVDDFSTPANWEKMLAKNPSLSNLRINFAHFGGEDGVDDMFDDFIGINLHIDKDSWTYKIIKMLKDYPNTYADISAYNYSEEKYRKILAQVFEYDNNNRFGDSGYKLIDKLLWGSDIPMVVSDKSYRKGFKNDKEAKYKHYYGGFLLAINNLANKNTIIENLTDKNPKKFLRIL